MEMVIFTDFTYVDNVTFFNRLVIESEIEVITMCLTLLLGISI